MTNEEQVAAIQDYVAAYNRFDVDGMAALLHPEVVFRNVSGGEVTAGTVGLAQFRKLADKSKALFSSRHQEASNFQFDDGHVTVEIAYEGVLAVDLPNGMKAGEVLRLKGRSEFEFKDEKIFSITDFS